MFIILLWFWYESLYQTGDKVEPGRVTVSLFINVGEYSSFSLMFINFVDIVSIMFICWNSSQDTESDKPHFIELFCSNHLFLPQCAIAFIFTADMIPSCSVTTISKQKIYFWSHLQLVQQVPDC